MSSHGTPHADYFFKKWELDSICNMRVGLYFLFLFTYITYALIFVLKMKDARKHRSYCLLVLFWYLGSFLFFFLQKIIKVEFSGTALK